MRMMKIRVVMTLVIAQVALAKWHASRMSVNTVAEDRARCDFETLELNSLMGKCVHCHKAGFIGIQCDCGTVRDVRHIEHSWTSIMKEDCDPEFGKQMDPCQTS